jgi:GMP synthase (glutamine-hydrolysing)
MNPPFLIVETGQPLRSLKRHGGFSHWIRVAAGLEAGEAVVANVERGDALPAHGDFAGIIVSGSSAMVTDRADWSERAAGWLRHALGGEVAYNPAGRESGTVRIDLHPPAAQDPLFAHLPEGFMAHTSHVQTVLRAPEGATVLARSQRDGCQAFRWGERAWGVQFHPEFATHHMRGYVVARAEHLRSTGQCPVRIQREVTAAPQARTLLRRFVRHARQARAR